MLDIQAQDLFPATPYKPICRLTGPDDDKPTSGFFFFARKFQNFEAVRFQNGRYVFCSRVIHLSDSDLWTGSHRKFISLEIMG